jgi:exodeoxyribonuclease-3
MKIISWNCRMAASRKLDRVLKMHPDLLIVQECSRADIAAVDAKLSYWVGNNPNKGLGVLGFGDHSFEIDPSFKDGLTWFIPVRITDVSLNVLGLWASRTTPHDGYVREAHKALDHYQNFLSTNLSVVMGDFNSNTIWDHLHRGRSHSDMVARLGALGLASVYHATREEEQGQETVSTFFQKHKGYHIDYAFASQAIAERAQLEILAAADWLGVSDHVPIVMIF